MAAKIAESRYDPYQVKLVMHEAPIVFHKAHFGVGGYHPDFQIETLPQ